MGSNPENKSDETEQKIKKDGKFYSGTLASQELVFFRRGRRFGLRAVHNHGRAEVRVDAQRWAEMVDFMARSDLRNLLRKTQ